MSCLKDILAPVNKNYRSCKIFLTFKNSDNCIVHVPITTSSTKLLRTTCDEHILSLLSVEMDKRFGKEYEPLLLPNSEFVLNTNTRPQRACTRLVRNYDVDDQVPDVDYITKENNSTTLIREGFQNSIDLSEFEKLCEIFINRRIEMGLSQGDVAMSLSGLYGINRSSTLISRFERMDLSLTNFFKVYPILLKWIKDTETSDGRNTVIRCIRSNNNKDNNSSNTYHIHSPLSAVDSVLPNRRQRTVLSETARKELESVYRENPNYSRYDLRNIANKLKIDVPIVRAWFYNRRQRARIVSKKKRKPRSN